MDSDDESAVEAQWGGSDGIVLMVDVSPEMWETVCDEKPITVALDACITLLRQIMISSPNQLIGMAFFGTKQNDMRINNTVQIFPLKQPAVDDITHLREIRNEIDEILTKWGITADFTYADALWQGKRMFSNCKKKVNNKILTILSRLEEPKPKTHRETLKGATEIYELHINVSIVHTSDKKIPDNSFFLELGKVIQPNLEFEVPVPVMTVETILPLIWQMTHKRRATALIPMFLGPDVKLGVGIYSLSTRKLPPKKINLHRETNEVVESSSTQRVHGDEDSRPVLRSELCMYANFGDRNIEFTNAEIIQLRKFGGEPYMKLLGFKPTSALNMSKWYLKPCSFLYPNEDSITGSTKLFVCLRDRCIAKDRIAICVLVPRWYCHPRIVALVPQKRVMENSKQVQPDGFHVIYMPYMDNLKNVIVNGQGEDIPEDELKCVEKMVARLKFPYTPGMFENPKLQTLHHAIEALALNDSNPQEVIDSTVPDLEDQKRRLKDYPNTFNAIIGPMEVVNKRPTDGSNKRKASEVETPDIPLLASRMSEGSIDRYTVPQLKQILKWRNAQNLPAMTGIKKSELVELVIQHCQDI